MGVFIAKGFGIQRSTKKKLCEAHEEMDPRILAKRKSQLATLKRLQEQDEVL